LALYELIYLLKISASTIPESSPLKVPNLIWGISISVFLGHLNRNWK